jgi:hypothetical protein
MSRYNYKMKRTSSAPSPSRISIPLQRASSAPKEDLCHFQGWKNVGNTCFMDAVLFILLSINITGLTEFLINPQLAFPIIDQPVGASEEIFPESGDDILIIWDDPEDEGDEGWGDSFLATVDYREGNIIGYVFEDGDALREEAIPALEAANGKWSFIDKSVERKRRRAAQTVSRNVNEIQRDLRSSLASLTAFSRGLPGAKNVRDAGFLNLLTELNLDHYATGEQQDSLEFLRSLLQTLIPNASFGVHIITRTSVQTQKINLFMFPNLDEIANSNLNFVLQFPQFFAIEKGTPQMTTEIPFITRNLPGNNMLFGLNRIRLNQFGHNTKLKTKFLFNDYIKINPVDGVARSEKAVLKLKGLVLHLGGAHSGHYISFTECRDKFYLYDDTSPRPRVKLVGNFLTLMKKYFKLVTENTVIALYVKTDLVELPASVEYSVKKPQIPANISGVLGNLLKPRRTSKFNKQKNSKNSRKKGKSKPKSRLKNRRVGKSKLNRK